MAKIVRWNPIREMAAMQSAMDRLFEDTWSNAAGRNWPTQSLALDVHETENEYQIMADLPGLSAENIEVTLHEGVLNISGEVVKNTVDEDKTRVHLQERFYGKFSRSLNLPQPINADAVEASFDKGVLKLILPKAENAKPRTIKINNVNLIEPSNN